MVDAEQAELIEAPAAKVWAMLNWRGIAKSMEGLVKKVEYSEHDGRPVRTFTLAEGWPVSERLERSNDADMHYYYRVIDNGNLPWTDYLGQIRVVPSGPNACSVKFQARFTPVGASADECEQLYRQNLALIIEVLKTC